MKKIASLIILITLLYSCQEDVKFNNPGFQAYRDGILFRGIDVKAFKSSNGKISIKALAQDEELTLNLNNSTIGTYFLGTTNTNNLATYSSSFNDLLLEYATVVISGPVAKIETPLISGGSSYTAGTGIATTGGSGSGLTVKTTVNTNGTITNVSVSSPGIDYLSGDVITISGGNNFAKFRVLNIEGSNGEITITENDGATISGIFKFNAIINNGNSEANELVNFQFGEFYKVPISPAP